DGGIQNSARSFPTPWTTFFGRSSWLSRRFPNNPITRRNLVNKRSDGNSPMEVDWVSGACMVVRRKAIEAVGPMDERFFMYWEDADWCRRMWDHGWRVVYYPKACIYHYGGKSSDQNRYRSAVEFHKSAYRLYSKYATSSLGKPFALIGLAVHLVFVLLMKKLQRG
ncbi:MAG: glycosyltransferase family 2 protein, partial [Desulfococcaceae bacterium]